MELFEPAYRHGLGDEEIRHAWDNALGFYTIEADTDPPKGLCVGPDIAGDNQ